MIKWTKSNDKTVPKDIPQLAVKYYKKTDTEDGAVLPFFVLSKNYDEQTRDFELFIGSLVANETLEYVPLPKGLYAKIIVKPKF